MNATAQVSQDQATKLMYEAAERAWTELGERHGYAGVLAGVAEVITKLGGVEVTVNELSRNWHNELVGFHDSFLAGTTFAEIARAMDIGYFGSMPGEPSLDYPWHGLAEGTFRYMPHVDPFSRIQFSGIVQEIDRHRHTASIRRGSAKYNAFVNQWAGRVTEIAIRIASHEVDIARNAIVKQREEFEALLLKAKASLAWVERRGAIRQAALIVARLAPDPRWTAYRTAIAVLWRRVIQHLEYEITRASEKPLELARPGEPQRLALERMKADPDLKPFAEAFESQSTAT